MQQDFVKSSQKSSDQERSDIYQNEPVGIEGKWSWPVRIFTLILYGAVVAINYFVSSDIGEYSNRFVTYITPPGFFFTIWAFIFAGLAIVTIYNLIKNTWNIKAHVFFGISNLLNIAWGLVFTIGTLASVIIAGVILIALCVFVFLTWIQIGKLPKDKINVWTYINRNIFAFYLGWIIAAANLNLGMIIVYWWGASKETQLIIFWVLAPLCAIGVTAFSVIKYGKYGLKSCLALWISVLWGFAGAAIRSNTCLNGQTTYIC